MIMSPSASDDSRAWGTYDSFYGFDKKNQHELTNAHNLDSYDCQRESNIKAGRE